MPNHKSHPAVKTVTGLAALAAAAGAYYFYGSKAAKQHRRQMKSWMVKAKADVMEELEHMKTLSQSAYEQAVNEALSKYKKLRQASPKELAYLQKELKGHWKNIAKHLPQPDAKPAKKSRGKKRT